MSPSDMRPERRWSNRAVEREIDPHWARRLVLLIGAVILAAAPASFYLLQQSECLRLSYEANARRAELERLVESERRLSARLSALESLDRIEMWATRQGELVRPEPGDVIVVRERSGGVARSGGPRAGAHTLAGPPSWSFPPCLTHDAPDSRCLRWSWA